MFQILNHKVHLVTTLLRRMRRMYSREWAHQEPLQNTKWGCLAPMPRLTTEGAENLREGKGNVIWHKLGFSESVKNRTDCHLPLCIDLKLPFFF